MRDTIQRGGLALKQPRDLRKVLIQKFGQGGEKLHTVLVPSQVGFSCVLRWGKTIKDGKTTIGVSETGSAKMASAIDARIDDVGPILNFRIGLSP